jgi:lipopolysaccharide export system protein LptA
MFRLKKMLREKLRLNNAIFGFCSLGIGLFILFMGVMYPLYADAYLAEDKIYYGADSYFVNYDDEIIKAIGHAYYRRGLKEVSASEIIIYYSDEIKKAFFYNNVLMKDKVKKAEIHGNYGEAHFKKDYYLVDGNAVYTDQFRTIRSQKIESDRSTYYLFSENIVFDDQDVRIRSQSLEIDEHDNAYFSDDISAVFLETGDDLYCGSIKYSINTGDSEFRNDVVYVQKKNDEGDTLVVKAENAKYFQNGNYFLLMDEVFILSKEYSLSSSMVKYYREAGIVESFGETVMNDGSRTVYSTNMRLILDEIEVVFFGPVRGVFRNSKGMEKVSSN